jgi:DNA-binding response OmpR family regulator
MKKILIADDEPEIIDLVTTLFETQGFTVVSTSYGSQLLALFEKERPDLVIMDVMMPGIDGYSLQLNLSQEEDSKHTPVIIISALSASKTLFDKFEQVKGFFVKPFNTDELSKKVKEILKNND